MSTPETYSSDSPAPNSSYDPEPWDTPEREAQARAHEMALRARRRRQSVVLLATVVAMLLVFLIAFAMLRGWIGGGGSKQAVPCPTQTVAKPADTTVRVFNGTSRAGLAANAAKALRARGYDVSAVTNAPPGTAGAAPAVVIHGAGDQARGHAVALQIAGSKMRADARTNNTVDLILGNSFKALRPLKAVEPLLKQVPMPAGCAATS